MKRLTGVVAGGLIAAGLLLIFLDVIDVRTDATVIGSTLTETVVLGLFAFAAVVIIGRAFFLRGSVFYFVLSASVMLFVLSIVLGHVFNGQTASSVKVKDCFVLLASVLFAAAAAIALYRPAWRLTAGGSGRRVGLYHYGGLLVVVGSLALLVLWVVVSRGFFGKGTHDVRSVVEWLAVIFDAAAAFMMVRRYARRRCTVNYILSLGLVLFASGEFFIIQGTVNGLDAWMGRLTQLVAMVYLACAALMREEPAPGAEGPTGVKFGREKALHGRLSR